MPNPGAMRLYVCLLFSSLLFLSVSSDPLKSKAEWKRQPGHLSLAPNYRGEHPSFHYEGWRWLQVFLRHPCGVEEVPFCSCFCWVLHEGAFNCRKCLCVYGGHLVPFVLDSIVVTCSTEWLQMLSQPYCSDLIPFAVVSHPFSYFWVLFLVWGILCQHP